MRIGELAKAANCPVETIRYYEQQGIIPAPYRTENNYRFYSQNHLVRLKFIRNCRSLDMTLEEIRELLKLIVDTPQENCSAISVLLDEHIKHVKTRIIELQELQNILTDIRKHCLTSSSIDHCGIVQELSDMNMTSQGHKTHLG